MARNEEVRSTVGSGKTLSWWQVLALVLLMVVVYFFGRLSALKSITVVDNNNSTASAAPANKVTDIIVTDNQPSTEVSAGNVGGNAGPSVRKPTYLSEFSCSDLLTCTVNVVPDGHFTIGFKKVQGGCDWWLYQEGEAIPFAKLDEFHTYNGDLPLTNLDGFVRGEAVHVYSCK
jgi:hypothetical protein